jgi:hypothetical protein
MRIETFFETQQLQSPVQIDRTIEHIYNLILRSSSGKGVTLFTPLCTSNLLTLVTLGISGVDGWIVNNCYSEGRMVLEISDARS